MTRTTTAKRSVEVESRGAQWLLVVDGDVWAEFDSFEEADQAQEIVNQSN